MLRLLLTARPPRPGSFLRRGHEVSRLEAFSDAVFGFIVTLLVISLDVPSSFTELMDRMSGVVSFAICFALLIHFWVKHSNFFRRFGLHDTTTIILNAMLLFVLLLYVYPLKYLFSMLSVMLFNLGPATMHNATRAISSDEVRSLFAVYGAGFLCIHLLFAAMYGHAFRQRHALHLSFSERFETVAIIAHNLGIALIPLLSIILSQTLPLRNLAWAGWIYAAIGPIAAAIGLGFGLKSNQLKKSAAQAPQT